MRADKTDQSFASTIHLAAAVITPDDSQHALVGAADTEAARHMVRGTESELPSTPATTHACRNHGWIGA